jgi:putative transposase
VRSSDHVRFNYRLRVSPAKERKLLAEWDGARWVWNRCVEASQKAHRASTPERRVTCGPAELDRRLTRWRFEHEWLAEGSSVPQQQVVRAFGKARAKALGDIKAKAPLVSRRGLPRFKSRHRELASLNYTRRGFSLKEDENGRVRLRLAGGVVVRPVWSRELPSEPSSVRVFRDALGDWWCSFVVEAEAQPFAPVGRVIGIDWGVSEIATTTSAEHDLPHLERAKSAQARLAHYQRMMARRKPKKGQSGSKGYHQAKRQVAKIHRLVARQRQDDARKWAKKVVLDFDEIAVEDFRPKFLARSTMAKKAADAAIGATKAELVAMARKHGRDLRLVDPSYTTMDCSRCGARAKHRLLLSERTYACEACGVVKPRDKNSAAVMVARAGFDPAGAESVRPEPSLRARAA